MKILIFISSLFVSSSLFAAEGNADVDSILKAADMMGPGNEYYQVDNNWKSLKKIVKASDFYQDVVEKIEDAICSSDYNKSVLLIGESSDAYKYIFARMALEDFDCQKFWHFNIDQASLIADHTYIGQMEGFWKKHISEPAKKINSVFYLENLFPIFGLGTTKNHPTGLESILAKDVSSGKLNLITFIDKNSMEKAKSLGYSYVIDSFNTQIFIDPMLDSQVINLAERKIQSTSKKINYQRKDLVFLQKQLAAYQPNVLEPSRTVNALSKFLNSIKKELYAKNIRSLDYCFSAKSAGVFEKEIIAPDTMSMQIELRDININNYFNDLQIIDLETGTVLEEIKTMQKSFWISPVYYTQKLKIVFNAKASMPERGLCIDSVKLREQLPYELKIADLRKAILDNSNVPQWLVKEDYSRLRTLEENLNKKIIGADESKRTLVRLAKSAYVTNRSDDKPLATTLLAGPTGTGKSFTAKVFAKELGLKRIVFDMTAYQTPYDVSNFVKELTTQLAVYPWGLYLFEEIDKAHPSVLDRLFFMMDEGIVYDNKQRLYSARGAFVMMTTNAASQDIINFKDHPELRAIVNESLQRSFRLSFLNRYDSVLIFKPFDSDEQLRLAKVQLRNKVKFLEDKYNWDIKIGDEIYDYVATKSKNKLYGARPMERLIEYILNYSIAEYQIEYGRLTDASIITIDLLSEEQNLIRMRSNNKAVDVRIDTDFNTGSLREELILDLF